MRSQQPAPPVTKTARPPALRVIFHAAVLAVILIGLAPGLVQDPFIRSDDYPVLLGEADRYWGKTLSEGRWLVWFWSLRPVLFDPHLVTALFLGLWSLTAALCGALVFGDDARPWRALMLTVALGVAPQMSYLILWPASLIPAMAIILGYTALASRWPGRPAVLAMWVFVPLSLAAYTPAPFVLLLLCAAAAGRADHPVSPVRLVLSFAGAFLLGLLLIFAANLVLHGHFGVAIDAWRDPAPAHDLSSLARNLAAAVAAIGRDVGLMGVSHPAWAIGYAALVVVALVRASRGGVAPAAAVVAVIAANVAMVGLSGVVAAFRASLHLHLAAVLAFALAARWSTGAGRGVWAGALAAAALPAMLHWAVFQMPLAATQRESRAMAEALRAAGGGDPAAIHLVGDPLATPHGAPAQGPEQLGYRLQRLLGRPVRLCLPDEPACEAARAAAADMPVWPDPGAIRVLPGGVLALNLPTLGDAADRAPPWAVHWTAEGAQGRPRPR